MADYIKAHFDGRVFVPDEPVNLRPGQAVQVQPEQPVGPSGNGAPPSPATRPEDDPAIRDRLDRFRAFAGRSSIGGVPLESMRRENLYGNRD